MNGGGTEMNMAVGKYEEQLFLKPHKLVENYCAVVARRDAWVYVSASRQDFNALLFATVVDCVLVVNVRHSKHKDV